MLLQQYYNIIERYVWNGRIYWLRTLIKQFQYNKKMMWEESFEGEE
jgi:hypothetical protein